MSAGGRPVGEIRAAMRQAAQAIVAERAALGLAGPVGATFLEIAQRAQVGRRAAQATVKNMARDGELQPVGTVKAQHARRPLVAWAPRAPGERWSAGLALDCAMRTWRR